MVAWGLTRQPLGHLDRFEFSEPCPQILCLQPANRFTNYNENTSQQSGSPSNVNIIDFFPTIQKTDTVPVPLIKCISIQQAKVDIRPLRCRYWNRFPINKINPDYPATILEELEMSVLYLGVLRIRTHFFGFGSTHFFSDSDSVSDPYTNILSRNFLKWCLSLLLYVFWNLYASEKSFPTDKLTFILYQVFDLRFSTIFFILQQCLDPNPIQIRTFFRIRIQPKYSEYFVLGSTTLVPVPGHIWLKADDSSAHILHLLDQQGRVTHRTWHARA
jgi:hypothetical protein